VRKKTFTLDVYSSARCGASLNAREPLIYPGDHMRSRAALGNHPTHLLLATLPVGAFSLVLLGDIRNLDREDDFRA